MSLDRPFDFPAHLPVSGGSPLAAGGFRLLQPRREELLQGGVDHFGRRDMAVLGEPQDLLRVAGGVIEFLLGGDDDGGVLAPAEHQQRVGRDVRGEGQRVFRGEQER